ncbi:MFS transporter [Synechococcales cyanobacterium C]|uniref:MFS transporter n=1 Tax=Petrachloros mirabilis ULC683 TaxID=2781853 RepID=A0A8K1ZXA5_9CYAN|nr:MFS transporter [Petrachloros mirabilis]NCJ05806.1 MFS transporter [Petrachloros mirabilis ULC683]
MWRDSKLLILLASGSLTVMTGAVLAPILPAIIENLPLDEGWAGTLVSAHYLTMAICSPVLGVLADRLGQLRLLILSLVAYSLVGVAGAFMPDFGTLLLTRGLMGIATSGIAAGSLGLLTRMYRADARTQAIAYASVALTLANIVYPLIAGGLGVFYWRLAFATYGLGIPIAIGAFIVFQRQQGQPEHEGEAIATPMKLSTLFRHPTIVQLLISLVIDSAIVFGMVVYLPIYAQATLNTDTGFNGIVLACMAIGSALSSVLALRWLTSRLGILRVIPLGLGVMAVLLVFVPSLTQTGVVILIATLFGAAFGLVTPSFYNGLATFTPDSLQSSVLATGIGAGFLGQFISPLILGRILAWADISGVFYAIAAASLITGLLFMLHPPQRPTETPVPEPTHPESGGLR